MPEGLGLVLVGVDGRGFSFRGSAALKGQGRWPEGLGLVLVGVDGAGSSEAGSSEAG